MKEVILNEDQFASLKEVHTYLAKALSFPAHYGKNYAALSDCLGDISEPVIITVVRDCAEDFDQAERNEEMDREGNPDQIDWDDFTKICRVLMRSARYNPSLSVMIVC
ncbi:MAG: barstar family protein [Eggerthellaceae bacterium]|nr:barstar family protein [Eggerthellaceae bacterium]